MAPGRDKILPPRQRGLALLMMLGLVALLGLGLAWAGPLWRDQAARERERDWLRIGGLYANALSSYIETSPGALRQGPERLEDLLQDKRFVGVRRHLRELYGDPLRPGQAWSLLRDGQQRVVGVYSPLSAQPFLRDFSRYPNLQRREGSGYAAWAFIARPRP